MSPSEASTIVNISAYRFVALDDLPGLAEGLRKRCAELELKGTILIAPEGINLFLAGARAAIDAFVSWIEADPRFTGLAPKESFSADVPFKRMRVRIKREIITMKRPVDPTRERAPAVAPATLRRWLDAGHDDAGRPVVLMDTRNAFEVDAGSFDGAIDYRIDRFSQFPAVAAADAAWLAGSTVVTFCTGGIRCEKAVLAMREDGYDHVWQLDGGILKYLELEGGAHWHGRCFVFDERESLDDALAPAR
ncbi:sulfurtransferase [Derxia gummosa]|uniref:Sulfurtransferase n=1 Tax=Derxia gummosa DSM 723 TaxID=1121388 RepID=A0A8B6X6B0_9BURK|nr:sulfurtransferase [Derxia gummosa]